MKNNISKIDFNNKLDLMVYASDPSLSDEMYVEIVRRVPTTICMMPRIRLTDKLIDKIVRVECSILIYLEDYIRKIYNTKILELDNHDLISITIDNETYYSKGEGNFNIDDIDTYLENNSY